MAWTRPDGTIATPLDETSLHQAIETLAAAGVGVLDAVLRSAVQVPRRLGDQVGASRTRRPAALVNQLAGLVELLLQRVDR